ncbi:carbon starvation induced protein CsiD [Algoriphagus chordae]|uniref:Alpha-ketoglutarate-dependent taurine dioxygenase n=1 Tax=Algoriphagus chordae TaxID=237019 RepID=A0A2W7S8L6_9BACT|nr:carbon starvation induced protein CsiD [Algoriphagus chordae]PZX46932.1 alpha-ketoglutarate-dependent taurine dioxygenase [Algoriphagus chordae]
MNQENYISLREKGWTEFNSGSSDEELISIASKIGRIINHPNGQSVFTLKPKLESKSFKGTFSNTCGLNEFPLHTDTAFSKNPARYILMHSKESSNCDTTLISKTDLWNLLSEFDRNNAKRAIYLVKTRTEKFYTSLIFQENGKTGIKYDSTCMRPFNKYAKEFDKKLKKVLSEIKPSSLKWTGGKTVIIDNWTSLHGRKSAKNDIKRELKRIYINEL